MDSERVKNLGNLRSTTTTYIHNSAVYSKLLYDEAAYKGMKVLLLKYVYRVTLGISS